MRPLRAGDRLGQPASARRFARRSEAALALLSGTADWSVLAFAADTAANAGAAVSTLNARRGTSPTAAGAMRPATLGNAIVFGGAQLMTGETGILGGATGATIVAVCEMTGTSGTLAAYGNPYYADRRMYAGLSGTALSVIAGNGETALANRNNIFAPIGAGMRAVATTHDRTQAAASELAVYDNGSLSTPTASVANDTTGTFQASQAFTIGAYSNGTASATMSLCAIGVLSSAASAQSVRRLSRLLLAACGVL